MDKFLPESIRRCGFMDSLIRCKACKLPRLHWRFKSYYNIKRCKFLPYIKKHTINLQRLFFLIMDFPEIPFRYKKVDRPVIKAVRQFPFYACAVTNTDFATGKAV